MLVKIKIAKVNSKSSPEGSSRVWKKFGFQSTDNVWYNFFAEDWNKNLQEAQAGDTVEFWAEEDPKYGWQLVEPKEGSTAPPVASPEPSTPTTSRTSSPGPLIINGVDVFTEIWLLKKAVAELKGEEFNEIPF